MNLLKIIVLSDTHGNMQMIQNLLPIMSECDMVFHLGDMNSDILRFSEQLKDKLYCVKGNCDCSLNKYKTIETDGIKILYTHGHMQGVKSSLLKLQLLAEEQNAQLILFGHTHSSIIFNENGRVFVNPGTLSHSSPIKSYAYITIANGKILTKIIEK